MSIPSSQVHPLTEFGCGDFQGLSESSDVFDTRIAIPTFDGTHKSTVNLFHRSKLVLGVPSGFPMAPEALAQFDEKRITFQHLTRMPRSSRFDHGR